MRSSVTVVIDEEKVWKFWVDGDHSGGMTQNYGLERVVEMLSVSLQRAKRTLAARQPSGNEG